MDYCILVVGIPAAGKTTMAESLSRELCIPVISKDKIKEIMYDTLGFKSRPEKVALGVSAMEIMYYFAARMMENHCPFILENNFEDISRKGMTEILDKYCYEAVTVRLTGDFEVIYKRFKDRNTSGNRHRGHVVNECYPENDNTKGLIPNKMSLEEFIHGFTGRGMDKFKMNGLLIEVDTTDFAKVDIQEMVGKIKDYTETIK